MKERNNNSSQNAVLRLAALPVVRSAWSLLWVVYSDTKRRHPGVTSVLEAVESGVASVSSAAYHRVSPVMVRVEPQIYILNDLTCQGIDWLEKAFPVLLEPTDKVTASAKKKMCEVKELASAVGGGTVGHVRHTLTWAVGKMHVTSSVLGKGGGANVALVTKALGVVSVGLGAALSVSEALVDLVLPGEDAEEPTEAAQGFEVSPARPGVAVQLLSRSARLCTRTCRKVWVRMHALKNKFGVTVEWRVCHTTVKHQLEEVLCVLSKSPHVLEWLVESLGPQGPWRLHSLPQNLQHHAMCALFFVSQMYNLSCPVSKKSLFDQINTTVDYLVPGPLLKSLAGPLSSDRTPVRSKTRRPPRPAANRSTARQ